jgi:hypothetical protein
MHYVKVEWKHKLNEEPVIIYMELDSNRRELRKIELYRDGKAGYASKQAEIGGSYLSEKPIPTLQKIAEDKQFIPHIISKKEFESIWNKYIKKE